MKNPTPLGGIYIADKAFKARSLENHGASCTPKLVGR